MRRKELSAILLDDFELFLKINNLFDDYVSGNILCAQCNSPITSQNIAMIYFKYGYKFYCDTPGCLKPPFTEQHNDD